MDALLQRQRHWFDDEGSPEMIGNVGKKTEGEGRTTTTASELYRAAKEARRSHGDAFPAPA